MGKFRAQSGRKQVAIMVFAVAMSAALLFMMLTGTDGTRVLAQTGDTPTPAPSATPVDDGSAQIEVRDAQEKDYPPKYVNMDSTLNELVQQVEDGVVSAAAAASSAPISDDESVAVTIYLEAGYADAVQQYLEDNGVSPGNVGQEYIEAYVPVTLLGGLSQQEGVITVSTIIPPQPLQEGFVGPGVSIHGADVWQQAGLKGEGVRIGVLDVGYLGFQELMGVEVPSEGNVHALCFNELGSPTEELRHCEIDSVHGTAVVETLYDIAPNATYYIANLTTPGDMRKAVEWMASHDVDVINMSAGWSWSGPGDGTSPLENSPLNTADYAAENGILWVNAAGNEAESNWIGAFNDPDGNDVHNFEGEDECNEVFLNAEETLIAQLRWDDVWLRARFLDLDLLLVHKETSQVVARSDNYQWRYPRPFELFLFEAEVKGEYCLEVSKFYGDDPAWIQVMAFTGQYLDYYVEGYEITDPAGSASPAMLAVGATRWTNTDEIEFFSSRGPTLDGRIKPDIVGVDGTMSVTYEGSFYGTSQASPHVAGLAALVAQNFPDMGAVDVAEYLERNALDRGEPGEDNTWGHGIAALPPSDASPPELPSTTDCQTGIEVPDNGSSGEVEIEGRWDDDCISGQTPIPPRARGDYYTRFYTFETTAARAVTITLRSSEVEDTFLYLLEDWGPDGDVVEFNDDIAGRNDLHSQLVFESLDAGRYTIEATTYDPETTGEFTVSIAMEVAEGHEPTEPPPVPAPVPVAIPADGYIDVSYGSNHACALHVTGTIYCFGDPEYGKTTPPEGEFESVSSGEHGSCAIREEDGKIVCWGIFELGLDDEEEEEDEEE